jgi:hypothetical protein
VGGRRALAGVKVAASPVPDDLRRPVLTPPEVPQQLEQGSARARRNRRGQICGDDDLCEQAVLLEQGGGVSHDLGPFLSC